MEEIDVNRSLSQADLFDLFRKQLKKDFEGAGIDAEFTEQLPRDLEELRQLLISKITLLMQNGMPLLSGLLYRVDISEKQLNNYQKDHIGHSFEAIVSELVIKRVLQKVILKRTYSK